MSSQIFITEVLSVDQFDKEWSIILPFLTFNLLGYLEKEYFEHNVSLLITI